MIIGKYRDIRRMNRNSNIAMGSMAFAFFVYIIIRAWNIPITVDESSTIITHVPRHVMDILFLQSDANPNNHLLNTLLIKLLTSLFGYHPFIVRLPALIGAFAYALAGLSICRKITNNDWTRVFSYLMLLGQPYLLDFFSLARGYSLGLGCLMTSLWFATKYAEKKSAQTLLGSIAFAGLAAYSNFTLVLFFGPFSALVFFWVWRENPAWGVLWSKVKYAVPVFLVWLILLAIPLKRLSGHSEITNWNRLDTLFGSSELSMEAAIHRNPLFGHSAAHFLAMFAAAFCLGMGYICLKKWESKGSAAFEDVRFLIAVLLPVILLANIAQVEITHTPYLQPRLALLYWPLFALSLGIAAAWRREYLGHTAWGLIIPLSIISIVNTAVSANRYEAMEWWHDQNTYTVLNYIHQIQQAENHPEPFTFDAKGILQNSFLFHVNLDPRGYNRIVRLDPWHPDRVATENYEFYYTSSRDDMEQLRSSYDIALEIPKSDRVLLRKKKK